MEHVWVNVRLVNPITGKEIETKASEHWRKAQKSTKVSTVSREMASPVLASNELNEVLIGVITLESLGLTVDPMTEELRETEILML